jgi:signal transduction histidine kinase
MTTHRWQTIKRLAALLITPATDTAHQTERLRFMERNVGVPVKLVVIAIILYYLYFSNWFEGLNSIGQVALEPVQRFCVAYALINVIVMFVLLFLRRLPLGFVQWIVGISNFIDGLFVAAIVIVTGGMDSLVYWIFLGLIVRNAVSIPVAIPQLALNLLATASYLVAGLLYQSIIELEPLNPQLAGTSNAEVATAKSSRPRTNALVTDPDSDPAPGKGRRPAGSALPRTNRPATGHNTNRSPDAVMLSPLLSDASRTGPGVLMASRMTELFAVRIMLLLFMTVCCLGVQVMFDKERHAQEEAHEFAVRQEQLRSTGRLAAEIAHQLKNPLSIINNAAFNLSRTLKELGPNVAEQIDMIREEVARSDRIITELMGYAQLTEGRVEKLAVTEELDGAISQVLPAASGYEIEIVRHYTSGLPPLLMQQPHLKEVLVNILLNAREALNGTGRIEVSAQPGEHHSVIITIRDNGPGIPAYQQSQIFEPYFSTKPKGTGLGLAIVRHNTELYGGKVRVESELGKGAALVLQFPSKATMHVSS